MLEEFAYLGPKKRRGRWSWTTPTQDCRPGREGLRLFPKHPEGEETFQPFWPEAADFIRNDVLPAQRTSLYGDPAAGDRGQTRLDKELGSIMRLRLLPRCTISPIKLVKKSMIDGYLVGLARLGRLVASWRYMTRHHRGQRAAAPLPLPQVPPRLISTWTEQVQLRRGPAEQELPRLRHAE